MMKSAIVIRHALPHETSIMQAIELDAAKSYGQPRMTYETVNQLKTWATKSVDPGPSPG